MCESSLLRRMEPSLGVTLTSGTRLGARRPALQGPLVRVLLDDVVVVHRHRVFVDDVLVH